MPNMYLPITYIIPYTIYDEHIKFSISCSFMLSIQLLQQHMFPLIHLNAYSKPSLLPSE